MLTLGTRAHWKTRRWLLEAGSLGLLGLGLPRLLRAELGNAGAAVTPRARSCVFVVQYGGASQLDTFDPKPWAPEEIRGPYRAIDSTVPGLSLGELLPRLAMQARHFTLLRAMSHGTSDHNGGMHVCMTGRQAPAEETPYIGSIVARFRPSAQALPSYVWLLNLAGDVQPRYLGAGNLGAAYRPLVVGKDEENPSAPGFRMTAFDPPSEVSADRAMARWRLLGQLEPHVRVRAPHMLDAAPRAMNTFQERAMDLVTGPAARRAFNLDLEPAPLRDAYGRNPLGQNLLLARRLVEAGVRLVTVNAWCGRASSTDVLATQGWDHHGAAIQKCGIFDSGTFGLGFVLPRFDAALAAFLADLHQRGLLESTLVVVVGEFGRSPQISKNPYPGREHWPQCYSALVAGGGIRGGLVHGASDRMGAYPASGKVVPEELAATILRQLGIDPAARFGPDGFSFRASDGEPIGAILG